MTHKIQDDVKAIRDWHEQWRRTGDFYPHTKELYRILDRLEKYEAALESVVSHNRTRGYPTGPEWHGIVMKVHKALEGAE